MVKREIFVSVFSKRNPQKSPPACRDWHIMHQNSDRVNFTPSFEYGGETEELQGQFSVRRDFYEMSILPGGKPGERSVLQ